MKRLIIRAAFVAGLLFLLSAIMLPRLGPWLMVEDPLQQADGIIVLGGTMYERPLEAVDLHKAGWAPRIYLFRQAADFGETQLMARGIPYLREIDIQVDVLRRLGVDPQAIEVLNEAGSTAEEAAQLAELATREQFARLIIVTSKQHTRRARLVMTRRLGELGVQVIMRASRYDQSDIDRWWANRSTLRFTLFEIQRLFGYWIGVAD